jgi:hypothetical protein
MDPTISSWLSNGTTAGALIYVFILFGRLVIERLGEIAARLDNVDRRQARMLQRRGMGEPPPPRVRRPPPPPPPRRRGKGLTFAERLFDPKAPTE